MPFEDKKEFFKIISYLLHSVGVIGQITEKNEGDKRKLDLFNQFFLIFDIPKGVILLKVLAICDPCHHDPLTHLNNSRVFYDNLTVSMKRAQEKKSVKENSRMNL